jgi:NADH-quinone oxidoreductase subunit G
MCDEGMLSYRRAHDDRVVDARARGAKTSIAAALDEVRALFSEAKKESVAIVLSAQHSLEDNWALLELGGVLLGTTRVYEARAPEGYRDDILIHADKNPNTMGVKHLAPGARPFDALLDDVVAGVITHVFALGGAAQGDAKTLAQARVVVVAAHEGPLVSAATVVLPATSWAEQTGTYMNAKGLRQVSEKALEPLGSSRPAWRHLSEVAAALGYEASWTQLRQIRSQLMGGNAVPAPVAGASAATPAE